LDSTQRDDIHVVVLAAGKGTRMKSQLPKVLHRSAGSPSSSASSDRRGLKPASITWSSATAPTK
jgi:bifunctional UDP-N-acetylglucosamine pyrophosphorylase/glucosamine-1-phosphate N-acetyltransferase